LNLPPPALPGLSPVSGKPIIAGFDGGQPSSDGGVVDLRKIERRLGGSERQSAYVADPRAAERVVHSLVDILRFRMLMMAAGYEDGGVIGASALWSRSCCQNRSPYRSAPSSQSAARAADRSAFRPDRAGSWARWTSVE